MRGLCHVCHASNVEILVRDGVPVCRECGRRASSVMIK